MAPTYTKKLKDDRYEYGLVVQTKGKRDKLIPVGIATAFEIAYRKSLELSRA